MHSVQNCFTLISRELPDGFSYKSIQSQNNGVKFRNCCTEKEFKFLNFFEKQTNTQWLVRCTYPKVKKYVFAKKFMCHHNSFRERKLKKCTRCVLRMINISWNFILLRYKIESKIFRQSEKIMYNWSTIVWPTIHIRIYVEHNLFQLPSDTVREN